MLGQNEKTSKLKELIELSKKTDDEVQKMNYKEKQKYYKAKTLLGTFIFVSKDKKGNGKTYHKLKKEEKK